MPTDPVCGMFVSEDSELYTDIDGKRYYFCSKSCMDRFKSPEIESRKLKRKLTVGWVFSIIIMSMMYFTSNFQYKDYTLLLFAIPVQFYSGLNFYSGAAQSIKNKSSNMDLLIAIGTLTAFFFSLFVTIFPDAIHGASVYYDASSFIITLILTGTFIENLSKRRANGSAVKLLELMPDKVHVIINDKEVEKPRNEVDVGELILVKPGEIIPVDGVVRSGASEIDQSMITGEQDPVLVSKDSNIFSGSRNLNGALQVEVLKKSSDSTVNRIYDLIQGAISGRVKIQKVADTFASVFVPVVLSVGAASGLFWYFYLSSVSNSLDIEIAILAFVSVVVIACPCAIGLAGPITLLISSSVSSQNGIVVKNPSSIERMSKATTVLFDKTGTLTESQPEILGIEPHLSVDSSELISIAASMERFSTHPVGKAIYSYAVRENIPLQEVHDFMETPGTGVEGTINGIKVKVQRSKDSGISSVLVKRGDEEIGNIKLSYSIRKTAKQAVSDLKGLGLKVGMVTGDSVNEAKRVGSLLGLDLIHAELKPDEKSKVISEYQERGEYVVFVGDGINDSIALETADAGFAMSTGSDIAKDTGDIILINDDLTNVPASIVISRDTVSKVRQNIGWAIGYNTVLIPVAAGVLVPFFSLSIYSFLPILSALAMGLSSTSVVMNSLLLKGKIGKDLNAKLQKKLPEV
ncbi:heavy metal translocating P-type ATPase [Cuniculiplasma divulgatum]|uniref:Copper/silver-transporting P-type ATPase n=1 Tax=Cuniculiplasma divulgatum TaxID=1673428 RepID=A0A1R4A759_9ARCH|nr:cation-translocating P-type ATPase [Cuniculiplasma divulgatum]SJK84786.1 copper/silver-transporting P-type ATPase [Cuniculiplasma divulgatum]